MFQTAPDLKSPSPKHKLDTVNKLASKLNIEMTPKLLSMTDTNLISEELISTAMENGTDPKLIDSALDEVS